MQLAHKAVDHMHLVVSFESNLGSPEAVSLIKVIKIKVWQVNEGVTAHTVRAAGTPGTSQLCWRGTLPDPAKMS